MFERGGGLSCSAILKIALVILHANPARGGAERYTVDLAHGLRERGHGVSVVASTFDGAMQADDVQLEALGATRAGRYANFIDKLERHLDEAKYDVVHAMLPVPRCDVYHPHAGIAVEAIESGHFKHQSALKRALAKAGTQFNRRRQRFATVERELLTGARAPVVLCLSEYIKAVVRRHYDLPDGKMATLFNAVDLRKFDPLALPQSGNEIRKRLGISGDKVIALMIAQDFARKGLKEAIVALALLKDARLVLVVVGKEDPGVYRQLARREGVEDRVIFAGPTSDPYSFYSAADFFVLPTRHDPCSLVVLEALAMGLPVISTTFNGACEIMTEGREGYVLKEPGDVSTLAGAMGRLMDLEIRKRMSRASLELRPVLSYEKHLERLLGIYRESVRS
ncbi:MAG TPA: glycosyltransferase family 4 protein [Tepidisphaeraceae bacterium]